MQGIAFLLTLLLLPYWLLSFTPLSEQTRGLAGVALLFAFTGIGHFIRTAPLVQMLPAWVPLRAPLVYATGVIELIACVMILLPQSTRLTGIFLCVFLVLILPSNIYAAVQRVDFGGHEAGLSYLWIRVPAQLFFIGWIYWFAVKQPAA